MNLTELSEKGGEVREPIRLWPGVVIVASQWIIRFGLPVIAPEALPIAVMGGAAMGFLFILWWLFFSRALWMDRLGALVVMVMTMFITYQLVDESIATAMMGLMLLIYGTPTLCLAFILWAVVCEEWSTGPRRLAMVASIVVGCGIWTLLRTGGFSSDLQHDFAWRWSETREERLLSNEESTSRSGISARDDDPAVEANWSGFRGSNRDGIIRGTQIETDWVATPPVELWRRPIGPGWSSFAVQGNRFYTQEQRGEEEVVSCYRVSSGELVWRHVDQARFWESNAGAGPRATPTIEGDRVYAMGATGILNVLDAYDGVKQWSRPVESDTKVSVPGWGFAGSPLVFENTVIVATAGNLAAYDTRSGDLRWLGPDGIDGYSSPHLVRIDEVDQVILMSKSGAVGLAPIDGRLLWNHAWPGGSRIVQPAIIEKGELLFSEGERKGMGRFTVSKEAETWTVEERWRTNRIKPYFSDFVVHKGYVYGFDGSNLVCINIEDGERIAKGGRYGSGQLILLADQDLLIVLSEKGELAAVEASPDELLELGRLPVLEGKTWNHPVLVGDTLLVRNDHEMAGFRLKKKDS